MYDGWIEFSPPTKKRLSIDLSVIRQLCERPKIAEVGDFNQSDFSWSFDESRLQKPTSAVWYYDQELDPSRQKLLGYKDGK